MCTHAVEVNECKVFATRRAADWWARYRWSAERANRVRIVQATIGGDVVRVACRDQSDAHALRQFLTGMGLPESALKVTRW